MDLLTHSIAEHPVDPLMAGHARAAFELVGNDRGKEMPPIPFDLEMFAAQAGSDEAAHVVSGGINH